jgi:PPP family 3-phenylpropionic acid transporter
MQISHGAFYSFYSIRLKDLGYSDAVIGWQWALAVICEVLMLTRVDRVVRRFGSPAVLRLCIAIATLRWLLVASTESLPLLTLSQTLHAFTYAAFHVAAIRIVHRSFAHARAKGQALYSGMTYGLGLFVGSTLAGLLATPLGLPAVFLLSAAIAASALLVLGRTHTKA